MQASIECYPWTKIHSILSLGKYGESSDKCVQIWKNITLFPSRYSFMCILFIKGELQLTEFVALICVKLTISCLQIDQSDFKPFLRLLSESTAEIFTGNSFTHI